MSEKFYKHCVSGQIAIVKSDGKIYLRRELDWTFCGWNQLDRVEWSEIPASEAAKYRDEKSPVFSDNEWHFPSKGEFPAPDRMFEVGRTDGTRMFDKLHSDELALWAHKDTDYRKHHYCWRYCDPLPPAPQADPVKASEDGFERWWITVGVEMYGSQQDYCKAAWLAAQAALKGQDSK